MSKKCSTYLLLFFLFTASTIYGESSQTSNNVSVRNRHVCSLQENCVSPQLISLKLSRAPTRAVLQWLAKHFAENIILSPEIHGSMSLQLAQLPWQQLQKIIFQSQKLGSYKIGAATYLAPIEEIDAYYKYLQEASEHQPLDTKLISLRYAKAEDAVNLIKGTASKRTSIAMEPRTNSVIVRGTAEEVEEIKNYLQRIDVAVPQILIATKIVNINAEFARELGVRFNLSRTTAGSGVGIANGGVNDQLKVNLPAVTNGTEGGLSWFKLNSGVLLDLELAALESEGNAKVISSPRLLTANQQPATIEAGESIPYQESAGKDGATTTSFKKAVLSLKVTPTIMANNKIILQLQINQDKRSDIKVKDVPTIDTRSITTQVIVEHGQTVVLGGIYEHSKQERIEKMPFLGDIPLLGLLFRHKKEFDSRKELLIFVTPKIVK